MSESESDTSVEEGQYVVEDIVDHRVVNGKLQFLLKWKGYDESENSWEIQKDLHCDDILAKYLSKHNSQIEEDLAKYSKKKKGRKKLNGNEISSSAQQKIEKQIKSISNANSKSSKNKINKKNSNQKDSNDDTQDLSKNSTELNNRKQSSNLDNDSDVVEINEISSSSTNNKTNNKKMESTEKQSKGSTLDKLNDEKSIKSPSDLPANKTSIDSSPTPAFNSFSESDFSDDLPQSEDFTNKPNFKIVAILGHKKNGNKLMCECLTNKVNIVNIPVDQVKKINMNAYLQYLESQIVNPF